VKPAPFEYHAPAELEEALELLGRYGGDARPLAGGQSLMPMLNLRLARPAAVVDLNRLHGLDHHRAEAEALVVGALCRQRDVELDREATSRCGALADAMPLIGHVAIRNRGTVVGSLAHADPSAEWPALALLLDATIVVAGPRGRRELAAADFFTGFFSTALEPGELALEARFPWPAQNAGTAFLEVARRHGDFALVGAAALLALAPDGAVSDARLVLAGVGPTAVRAVDAERRLVGRRPDEAALAAVAAEAASKLEPAADIHAPAAYRRQLAETLARRVLQRSLERARADGQR
jgi:carbon-monoxide dehydrogenase medium subunit